MKKLLIAAAALAVVAGTAQAQSSVTVYGAVGASTNSVKTNDVKGQAQFQDVNKDYLGTTNFGFTGTEDLGSGNKAFFRLEGDLSMSGGLGAQGATAADQNVFNRHAHVGIESSQFGTVSAGRQNDSIKDIEGLGQVYNLSDNLHIFTLVGDRYAQVYKYATPTFNGLKATYSYSNGPANKNATTDNTTTLNSYALTYAYKNYSFGAAHGTLTGVAGTFAGNATATEQSTTLFGARAIFGDITVGAHHSINEEGAKELKQTMISANYAMGKIELKAHYVTNDASGTNGADVIGAQSATDGNGMNDGDGYGLMAVYNLSKRTAAYVGYADFDATTSALSKKVTTVGVLHKF